MAASTHSFRIRFLIAAGSMSGLFGIISWMMSPTQTNLEHAPTTVACTITIEDRVRAADVILQGRVAIILPNPHDARLANVVVQPDQVFRGTMTEPSFVIRAFSDSSDLPPPGDKTALHFTSTSDPYLFFLHAHGDGTFETSACAGTRPLGSGLTPAERQALQGGAVT